MRIACIGDATVKIIHRSVVDFEVTKIYACLPAYVYVSLHVNYVYVAIHVNDADRLHRRLDGRNHPPIRRRPRGESKRLYISICRSLYIYLSISISVYISFYIYLPMYIFIYI